MRWLTEKKVRPVGRSLRWKGRAGPNIDQAQGTESTSRHTLEYRKGHRQDPSRRCLLEASAGWRDASILAHVHRLGRLDKGVGGVGWRW